MDTRTRPTTLFCSLLAALLLAGCGGGDTAESPDGAPTPTTTETSPSEPASADTGTPTEAASTPERAQHGAATVQLVWKPGDKDPQIAIVEHCSRPSGELSLDFKAQRTDGIVIEIQASDGSGTATVRQPGAGTTAIEEESGPAELSQQDGALLVTWSEYELTIENCGT